MKDTIGEIKDWKIVTSHEDVVLKGPEQFVPAEVHSEFDPVALIDSKRLAKTLEDSEQIFQRLSKKGNKS